ncbi:hypothetical protein LCGC14_0350120 [marine sediment metagenome]|uniref:Uncharacterized protein n=1 Tax=marine sediment metagenome TaxID=412755 RepID=A0A0F9TB66_9ZZZZ
MKIIPFVIATILALMVVLGIAGGVAFVILVWQGFFTPLVGG